MNLHRTDSKPDWVKIPKAQYSIWQRLALLSRGFVTPGNMATALGLGLVLAGLYSVTQQHYGTAVILVVIGRLCDLLDGWLADITLTKSPLGEMLDATVDKVETVLAIAVFYIASVAPWWVLTALLVPHIWIAVIALMARTRNVQLHPSRLGKVSMAALWVALFGFVIMKALDVPDASLLAIATYVVSLISVLLSVWAAAGYILGKD
jgi:phosphatidylglycerophosphate synthase